METTTETNLQRILRMKNIGTAAIGPVIGVRNQKTVLNKLTKKYPFNLPEARALHRELLPEYDFDYLFAEYDRTEEPEEEGQEA